jgi:hypothetical protein
VQFAPDETTRIIVSLIMHDALWSGQEMMEVLFNIIILLFFTSL